mmetsp:Transcript_1801/g.4100  ORF Transcript_1801/g.4100 Transcript_1801/m.4100 type:complete len:751 (-) Transcript_1801:265-2517(-)
MAACDVARVARASLACAGPRSRASQQFDGATRRFASRPASASRATGALRRVHRARPYRGGAACSSAADDDGGEGEGAKRDAAAAAGMLAPLDVCTLVGAELDDIMKTDPVAFERALTDKLRALASEVVHPSFPGGRSSALRNGLDPHGGGGSRSSGFDFDFRHAAGLHQPPHAAAASPEYLTMEGWRTAAGDDYVPDEAQDAAMLRELAAAVVRGAKAQRQREVQDILYLHVVHRFNTLGVPLAPHPGHYRGSTLSAALAPNRHMIKVTHLVKEMLPPGAEALLEKHLDYILANVDDPELSGRVGSAGVPAVTLAQVYSQSAAYGYFLQVVSRRLALEHTFRAVGVATSADTSPSASGATDAAGPGPGSVAAVTPADITTVTGAMGGAKSSQADGWTMHPMLASNVVSGALPAFPSAIGDWLDYDDEDDWEEEETAHDRPMALTWGDSMVLEKELKWSRERERESLASAAYHPWVGGVPAEYSSIGDWFAPEDDDLDLCVDYPQAPEDTAQQQQRQRQQWREEERRLEQPLGNPPRHRGVAVGGGFGPRQQHWRSADPSAGSGGASEPAAVDENSAGRAELDGGQLHEAKAEVRGATNGAAASAASFTGAGGHTSEVQELQAFVQAMDPQLRATAARVIGVETTSVLENHVEALFGSAEHLAARLAAALGPEDDSGAGGGGGLTRAARVQRAAMHGDVDVVRMPLDALRYLVVEAAAFGAGLYGAEKTAEAYELIKPWEVESDIDGLHTV